MEKFWNKFGNIMYYTFNFLTLPIIVFSLCFYYHDSFPKWMLSCNNTNPPTLFFFALALCGIGWRYQYLIMEAYSHKTKFGLDFYKHKRKLDKFNNLKAEYNKATISNHLEKLFTQYCNDESICIRHTNDRLRDFRGGNLKDFIESDKNFITGQRNSYIYNAQGYKIDLGEEPPLFLVEIETRFYNELASMGASKKLKKAIIAKSEAFREENGKESLTIYNGYDNIKIELTEYAIIMGTLIDFVTETEYNKLKNLHKQAEFNYDEYILNKRKK